MVYSTRRAGFLLHFTVSNLKMKEFKQVDSNDRVQCEQKPQGRQFINEIATQLAQQILRQKKSQQLDLKNNKDFDWSSEQASRKSMDALLHTASQEPKKIDDEKLPEEDSLKKNTENEKKTYSEMKTKSLNRLD